MYTTDYIFTVLPIKYLIKKDGKLNRIFKLATGKKPSVSHLRVLFCTYVVRKATANVYKKALNMHYQAQKGFCGIFVGITQNQNGYLMYRTSTNEIIPSYDVVLDESVSSMLAYTSLPYSEEMPMCPDVTYILMWSRTKSYGGLTGYIT